MDPGTEREVLFVSTVKIEPIRLGKARRIAVGGAQRAEELLCACS